jgi:lipoprotein-releasing system ATP-binding protein
LTDPQVVFADEPTGNLDEESADVVWQALADHAATGATVVLATHDGSLVKRCDNEVRLGGAGTASKFTPRLTPPTGEFNPDFQ